MNRLITKNILHDKSLFINIFIFLVLIFLFVYTQGILWYMINMFLYISILNILWLFYKKIKTHCFVLNKLIGRREKNIEINKKILKQLFSILLGVMLFLGYILFMFGTPYIKGSINGGYLHDVVNDIIKGKNTDKEKIGALLAWFDRNSDNMYNSWFLIKEKKVLLTLIPDHFYILTEMPYFGIRCSEDMDGKWILTSRFGACGEYSRIFMYMADAIGVDVRRVHAPGEDHVWDEVKINGEWIPVDPTNVSLPDGDGWEDYSFFEYKEGNVSYVWAEYLHNDTIEDLTSLYTNLTNITIHAVDKNNNSLSDVTITIISHNLKRDPNHETSIPGKPKPRTNESGFCIFQIGGGNYTFNAQTNDGSLTGKLRWVEFSDDEPFHEFKITLS